MIEFYGSHTSLVWLPGAICHQFKNYHYCLSGLCLLGDLYKTILQYKTVYPMINYIYILVLFMCETQINSTLFCDFQGKKILLSGMSGPVYCMYTSAKKITIHRRLLAFFWHVLTAWLTTIRVNIQSDCLTFCGLQT